MTTVEATAAPVPQDEQQLRLVRDTADKVSGLYESVKNYSPMLKTGLETVESTIPTSVKKKVASASNPMIEQVDSQIDQLKKDYTPMLETAKATVQDRVVVPVTNTYNALDADADGYVSLADVKDTVMAKGSEVKDQVYAKTAEVKGTVFAKTAEVKDQVYAKTAEKVGEWKDLRGDLSKKAIERMEKGLADVKEFSATRGKDMIKFDLIEYSRQVLDNANSAVKPLYEPLQQNLAAAVVKVNESVTQLQDAISTKTQASLEQVEAAKAELRTRLHAAMEAARELSTTSVTYVNKHYQQSLEQIQSKLPTKSQAEDYASQLPPYARASLLFILASPQLFAEVAQKADISSSKRMIDNVNDLLAALKDVLIHRSAATISTSSDGPAAMEITADAPAAKAQE